MIFGIDRWPDDYPALKSDNGTSFTYGALRREIARIGGALCGRKLIFCMCSNTIESVCGYLAFLESGSVSLLLGNRLDPKQLENLIDIYTPAYIWMDAASNTGSLLSGITEREPVITSGSYGLYETGFEPVRMHDDLALLLSTSGSTGSPKLIRLSRGNLESNAESIASYLELNERELPITSLPMQYTFGLSVINSHLWAGAAVLMTDKSFVQQDFWDLVKEYKVTSFSGVPYTYELLHRIHFMDRDDTGSITSMIQAGGHLPVQLQEVFGRWANERGVRFYVMYGQTEATARMSYLPWDKCLDKIGTIGIAIPGGRFELQDEDGHVIEETGVPGELVYHGPNVSLGYAACAEDLAKPDERHGVLHTGDLASADKDGYYTIRGRLGRFVKIYGVRVGLDECENILKDLDVDAEFVCIGEDDRLMIVTDSENHDEAPAYLADRLHLNIRAFKSAYEREIPMTESGKKDYSALKKKYIDKRPAPYSLLRYEKDKHLTIQLKELCRHHMELCPEYARMMRAQDLDIEKITDYRQIPPLPVGLFKEMSLSSLETGRAQEAKEKYKVLTSSGTSGQAVSQIVLDGETRTAQQKALAEIGSDFLGEKRLPMLVVDCESTVKDRTRFSARTAGIQGFSLFGTDRTFALKEDMSPDSAAVTEFLERHGDGPFLMFGFTYIIWKHLVMDTKAAFDMSQAILIHGGGWKKLQDLNISEIEFRKQLKTQLGITRIHDYYGMAEQAGSIFMECEEGYFHCSDYSGIVIRRASDMSECDMGEKGIIEVLSVLPKSYPGHALLTEDEGVMMGEDTCPCGRRGAYFRVAGRIPHAQLRGCSDTYEGA